MARFTHVNIIAKDWRRVAEFYQNVFGCVPLPHERDLKGEWVDKLTGIPQAHITGIHMSLPGCPGITLEIFSYDAVADGQKLINKTGFSHIAFAVDSVEETLGKIIEHGGAQYGELANVGYPNNVSASFVYAKDIEGNVIELQKLEGS